MKQISDDGMVRSSASSNNRRTNAQWVAEINGTRGTLAQHHAITDIFRYLHIVAFNSLHKRQENFSRLRTMNQDDMSELACDFVQETLAKLAENNFTRLNQFKGTGKFTSWAAQIINNEIASELRKVDWDRMYPVTSKVVYEILSHKSLSPERFVIQNQQVEILHQMLSQLQPKLKTALTRCILQEETAAHVAAEMGITINAVYMLVHRAKRELRAMALATGFERGLWKAE